MTPGLPALPIGAKRVLTILGSFFFLSKKSLH